MKATIKDQHISHLSEEATKTEALETRLKALNDEYARISIQIRSTIRDASFGWSVAEDPSTPIEELVKLFRRSRYQGKEAVSGLLKQRHLVGEQYNKLKAEVKASRDHLEALVLKTGNARAEALLQRYNQITKKAAAAVREFCFDDDGAESLAQFTPKAQAIHERVNAWRRSVSNPVTQANRLVEELTTAID